MNIILQKRIEEAAEKYAYTNWENDDYHEGVEEGMPFDPIGYLEKCFKKAATFALQNQWIPVEEALPEEDIPNCFVTYKTLDMVFYSTGSYEKDNDEWYVDSVGFNVKVTHWMQIPSLKGGEK